MSLDKPCIVIVEGPDNIGKTMLCNLIAEKLQCEVVHDGPPKSYAHAQNKAHTVVRRITKTSVREVWDRSIIGETVYGPIYRGYEISPTYWKLLQSMDQLSTMCILVVLYADTLTFKRFSIEAKTDEEKIYQTRDAAQNISCAFIKSAEKIRIQRTLLVNSNNYESLDARNRYVMTRINHWISDVPFRYRPVNDYRQSFYSHRQRYWDANGFTSQPYTCPEYGTCKLGVENSASIFGSLFKQPTQGYGNTYNPKYVFVGEAPGYKGCGKLGIPFYDDTSGNMFQDTMEKLGLLPTEYYVTNTIKCCPTNNDLGEFAAAKNRYGLWCVSQLKKEIQQVTEFGGKVVAVGKVAYETLKHLGILSIQTYHPAYFVRMGVTTKYADYMRKELKI